MTDLKLTHICLYALKKDLFAKQRHRACHVLGKPCLYV